MSTGTLSSQTYESLEIRQDAHSIFRGHAFSFLVSASVLLGSMFAAHSAIVELASVNAGERLLSFVVDTRSFIGQMPERAGERMAVVAAATQQHGEVGYEDVAGHMSFSSGLEGLFEPYISLVTGDIQNGPIQSAESLYGAEFYGSARPTGLGASYSLDPAVLSYVLEGAWTALEPYVALSEAVMESIAHIEGRATATYVAGVYGWVEASQGIAEKLVVGTYTIGDKTIAVATGGMPLLHLERMPVLSLWVATAQELAYMFIGPQLAMGEQVLSTANEVRSQSAQAQYEAGEIVATMTSGLITAGADIARSLPRTATASVADFLVLEPR